MITPSVLADAVRELLDLPRLAWHEDPVYGITLEATGSDAEIRNAVWAYAAMFGTKPVEMPPTDVFSDDDQPAGEPGWIVAELPIFGGGITVAGRLVEAEAR